MTGQMKSPERDLRLPQELITVRSFDDLSEMADHHRSLLVALLNDIAGLLIETSGQSRDDFSAKDFEELAEGIMEQAIVKAVRLHNGLVSGAIGVPTERKGS